MHPLWNIAWFFFLCSETPTSSLLRLPEKADLKKHLPFAPQRWCPHSLSPPFHEMLNFMSHHQHLQQEVLLRASETSCRAAAQLSPPQGDRTKEGSPAIVAWHFPWLLRRNSWAIIEGYLGIPTGLTGAHILNRADTKFIQLLECYYSLGNPREVSDADL